jgi:hypothetical protein
MLAMVVPFSIGFFGMGMFAIRIMMEAALGKTSIVVVALDWFNAATAQALLPGILGSYAILWALRIWVRLRLRRAH